MAPQLAWIGLGNMGRGMAKNIVEKGELTSPLILYNRSTYRAEDLSKKLGSDKTKVATTLEEATKPSDIIFTCVGDDKAITETIDTIVQGDVKGKLFVDCSTIHPDTTRALNKTITSKGAHFVACPVFGAPAMADNGQLICVISGPKEDVARMLPYTKGVMSRANIDFTGQDQGQSTLLKLIGNTFVLNMVEALGEGLTMSEKTGLGVENLQQFIEIMFPGPYTAYTKRMITGDYYGREEPLFAVDLALKDAGHALDMAGKAGAVLPSLEVCRDSLKVVKEHEGKTGDLAGIYGSIRKRSGLQFENGKK